MQEGDTKAGKILLHQILDHSLGRLVAGRLPLTAHCAWQKESWIVFWVEFHTPAFPAGDHESKPPSIRKAEGMDRNGTRLSPFSDPADTLRKMTELPVSQWYMVQPLRRIHAFI